MKKLLLSLLLAFLMLNHLHAQEDSYFEVSKNLEIFTNLYKQVDLNYVDGVQPSKMMKTGIDAMLKTLDPYTVYITEGDVEDYRFMTTGEYGGIGAVFHLRDGIPELSELHPGYPADKAGLVPGDRILSINDNPTEGRTQDEISSILHGQPGTEVRLEVKKVDAETPVKLKVTRQKIKTENIPYYGMIGDGLAYIKMNAFTQNAASELQAAFQQMKKEGEVKGLIIDLRGNGGGLLMEAVKICNLFLEKDQLIVSTKGKMPATNAAYKTQAQPLEKELPLAVLIDHKSASASEIVSGALQDLDRAVIIGTRSFGKGLVQNVFPLSYNAQVKITTAKYYIPSGRCIQAIDYSHKDEFGRAGVLPDSLTNEFKTRKGRLVRDGGGIEPDIYTQEGGPALITRALLHNFKIFDFATQYRLNNPIPPDTVKFRVDDKIFQDFKTFLAARDFSYDTRTEDRIRSLELAAGEEGYADALKDYIVQVRKELHDRKSADLDIHRDEIARALRLEIISRYHYETGKVVSALSDDPDILKAKEVLLDPQRLAAVFEVK